MSPRSFRSHCALSALAVAAISVGAAGALAVGAPGCTVLTNDALPDDAGTFEGGGDAGPSTACTSCVTQECTGAWAVCLTDSRCVALRGCNNPFGESQGARDQCFCDNADASAAPPDGGADPLAAYGAFASCNDARTCDKCATDCASACAGGSTKTTAGSCGSVQDDGGTSADAATDPDAGDAGDADASDAATAPEAPSADRCSTCVASRCGDPKKACAIGSECSVFLACAYGCADVACVDACGKSHSTGKESATELSTCTLTSCRSACGY
jgi:hypothetical protein